MSVKKNCQQLSKVVIVMLTMLMMMITVMMKSKTTMLLGKKRKWLEAKFGGNDRGFHLGANMSALQPAAAESTLRSIEKADCGVSALPLSLIVMLMLVKMVIKAMQMMSECDSVGDGAGIADGDGDIGDTRNQSLRQDW